MLLVLAAVGASRTEDALKVGGFSLPGTEFNTAAKVLSRDLEISSDRAALVVFHSPTLRVTDKPFADAVDGALERLSREEVVTKTESVYSEGLPLFVSRDNHTTYAWVFLEGGEAELEEASPRLRALVRSPIVETYLVGQAAANHDIEQASADDLARVERFTLPVVGLLLVLVFGSLVAAAVPLVLGAGCVLTALALIYVLAEVTEVSIFALNISTMIGLGLAIDFSLIMVSRFREELRNAPLEQALDRTLQTAGRSITYSGITLGLTMAVLALFPVMIIRTIAVAILIVAAVAVVLGLTLLPVLLVLLNRHLDRLDLRRLLPQRKRPERAVWAGLTGHVMRRPWASIALALLVLGLMALPAAWMRWQGTTVDVLPEKTESRAAVELVQRQFGEGEVTPLFVVVQTAEAGGLWQPDVLAGVYALHMRLEADPRVDEVESLASLIPNPSEQFMRSLSPATIETSPDRKRIAERLSTLGEPGTTTVLVAHPRKDETDDETIDLLLDARSWAKEDIPGLERARVLVGGTPAQHHDFLEVVYDQFPLLLALSLLVTFVVLMLLFHSLVLPLTAIVLNLLSLLASYGALVLVFQWGVGDGLLGFDALGALQGYTPVILFSILFGLSTDYQVFLLTRVREYVRQGYSTEEAIALGVQRTAGIITAAALIMVAVFGSFALTGVLVIKEIGFGLAVAVAVDATMVRLVLVPAVMKLLGSKNWWMPKVLDQLVPEIDEGEVAPARR